MPSMICKQCGKPYIPPMTNHKCTNYPKTITDKDRLDFLQRIMVDEGKYSGKCILRRSTRGHGYRLHETKWKGAGVSVRNEIDRAMMGYL